MRFQIVDFNNYKTAIQVQNEIFPTEDGTINILASLDRELFIKTTEVFYPDDNVKYYLVYNDNDLIGITGLYCNKELYPNDVWIAWYGVLPKYRGKGFGEQILIKTMELGKKQGYETMRLYTDANESANAINLYKKVGFIGEKYDAEELIYDCYIYSKSLTESPTELWNNKMLELAFQTELDHMDESRVKDILNKYE